MIKKRNPPTYFYYHL